MRRELTLFLAPSFGHCDWAFPGSPDAALGEGPRPLGCFCEAEWQPL